MFHQYSAESKQQGAIDAARDPRSKVTAQDAERAMVDQTRAAGGAAFHFNPKASPEEKAAEARAMSSAFSTPFRFQSNKSKQVPADFHHQHRSHAAGLVSDQNDTTLAHYDLSTTTVAAAASAPPRSNDEPTDVELLDDARWSRDRTGWAPRFGHGDKADDEGPTLLDAQTWLDGQLEDKWFGDWYYNAGVIIFACLSTYVTTLLGGGLAWVFIIMATCGTYYRTSLRRVRRNFRDDIRRELAKTRIETDTESLEWMNGFLVKFWPIFAPVLCDSIINSVDQVLSTSTPAFVESLRLKTFILGTKPPRLEHVKTYEKTDADTILMDWKFSFNPNDTADFTARQLKNKINPKVVLEIRLGMGVVSKGLDVIVEDFAFSGTMRVKMKLQVPFPHVERAEVSFLGKPTIDYVCKPLGGDTFGFDINFIPGLEKFILDQIHANLGPILYDPNVFPIEIAKMLAGNAVDQAIGVIQVTIIKAEGLKNPDKFPGIPDPYVILSTNAREVMGKTKTVKQNATPQWHETFNVVIASFRDHLTFQVHDWNEFRKDRELGTATFPLEKLIEDNIHENLTLEVMDNGRACGIIQASVRFFPVLEGDKMADGKIGPPPESNTGIVKFTVEQAKELDGSKSLIGQLNPYAVLLLNGAEVQISRKLKRTNNPIWTDATKEILITNRQTAKLGLVIKDERELGTDQIVGTYQIRLNDLMELSAKGQEWYNLAGVKSGRAKMLLQWKPVALKGGAGGKGSYITPIGVLRFHLHNAKDLRNLETMGKSDPYVRVLLSGIEKARTVTFLNNLNPDFDEVVYIPVHSPREKLTLEVMDQEKIGADRSLGLIEILTSDFIKQGGSGEYPAHNEKKVTSQPLKLGGRGSPKGTLTYTCAFYPSYNVVDPEEADDEKQGVKGTNTTDSNGTAGLNRNTRSGTVTSTTTDATKLLEGEKHQEETRDVKVISLPKLKLAAEDLHNYESGLLVFKVIEAELAHTGVHVEIVMDDMLYPSYVSPKARTKLVTFNETADAMVRELDVSRITLRLREKADKNGEGKEDRILGRLVGNTLDVLKRGLYQTMPLTLRGEDGLESRVHVQLKYIPIQMDLDPSESINNMGSLRVDILSATDLPAADRNGLSDPYCKIFLNDKQIHKTEVQKKTLQPAWNEFFEVAVPSRTAAKFRVECWDWDRSDRDDHLGSAVINLGILEPFAPKELVVGLDGKSGSVRLKILFKPDYVTRSKHGTSTFNGTFTAPAKIIGAPVKDIGKGVTNVIRGASFVGRGFRRKKDGSGEGEIEPNISSISEIGGPVEGVYQPSQATATSPLSNLTHLPYIPRVVSETQRPSTPSDMRQLSYSQGPTTNAILTSGSQGSESGVATVAILSAAGFEGNSVRIYVRQNTNKGQKDVHKSRTLKISKGGEGIWDEHIETFRVNCTSDAQFAIQVKDTRTFGTDVDLGEGVLSVADAASALGATAGSGTKKVVRCGQGSVTLKTSFTHADQSTGALQTNSSPAGNVRKSFIPGRSSREKPVVQTSEQ